MNYECLRIQKTLKSLMKTKKITYTDLGKKLNTSPATIKRRLNGEDISLSEIKKLSEALGLSFYELLEMSKKIKKEPSLFTPEQEKILSSDIKYLLLFRLVVSGLGFNEIKKQLNVSESDLRKLSKKLESVQLLQLHPKDRFQSLVEFPFKWQPNGELHKTYDQFVQKNILQRINKNIHSAGLNHNFEIILNDHDYANFCNEITEVYRKYSSHSELLLETQPDLTKIVSGLFYIDRFSIWDD